MKFKFKYPKDYTGKKYYNDGDVEEVSKESAEDFEKQGIGSIVTGKEAAEDAKSDATETAAADTGKKAVAGTSDPATKTETKK